MEMMLVVKNIKNWFLLYIFFIVNISFVLSQDLKNYRTQSTLKEIKSKEIKEPVYNTGLASIDLTVYSREVDWSGVINGKQKFLKYEKEERSYSCEISLIGHNSDTLDILKTNFDGKFVMSINTNRVKELVISKKGSYPININLKDYVRKNVKMKAVLYGNNYGGERSPPVRTTHWRN